MAASDEKKWFLDSSNEVGRLQIIQNVYKAATKGRLIRAPVAWSSGSKTILDVAGADGAFLRDLVHDCRPEQAGSITAITTDIMDSYFPSTNDTSLQYYKHDSNKPFPKDWEQRFDVIHQRFGFSGAGSNAPALVDEFFRMTKPGGWVQITEIILDATDADGMSAPDAGKDFRRLIQAVIAHTGLNPLFATQELRDWVIGAGFVDVQEETVNMLFGPRNADPELGRASLESNKISLQGMIPLVRTFNPRPSILTGVDLDTLEERYLKEVTEVGDTYSIRIVWGRRPQ